MRDLITVRSKLKGEVNPMFIFGTDGPKPHEKGKRSDFS